MARMKQRRRTAAEWTSEDEVLYAGEMGVETDTLRFKIGDGTTAWTDLDYSSDPAGSAATAQAAAEATAAAALSTHAGAVDPHPGYLTPTEGNAAYDAAGAAAAAQSAAATDATNKANAAQAAAIQRANHTGSQAISTVTGLQTALDAKAGAVLARSTGTAAQTGITTIVDLGGDGAGGVLTITFTVTAGRPVDVVLWLPWVQSVTASATATAKITDGSGTQTAQVPKSSAAGEYGPIRVEERITAAGTYTRKGMIQRGAGTGTITVGAGSATATHFIEAIER